MTTKKGVKLSLGEFMGDSGGGRNLPTAPKVRGPDDDGSFQRHPRRGGDQDNSNYEPTRSEGDSNWRRGGGSGSGERPRGGGFGGDRGSGGRGGDRGGGDRFGDRGGGDRRGDDRYGDRGGGGGRGGDFGARRERDAGPGNWRADGASRSMGERPVNVGERPRLQLKARVGAADASTSGSPTKTAGGSSPFGAAVAVDATTKLVKLDENEASGTKATEPESAAEEAETKENNKEESTDVRETSKEKVPEKKEKTKREPDVVNSRAAAFGAAPEAKAGGRRGGGDRGGDRGPPPVRNARFEKMAEEERDRRTTQPPQVTNSRFAAAAEMDRASREPLPVANSRFAAAAEADGRLRDTVPESRGPPPVAKSRFAAAAAMAEEDRALRNSDERGPPPTVTNSRFAAAAEADGRMVRETTERGPPPPVANSRFAAAAAMAEEDRQRDERRREERAAGGGGGFYNREQGPAVPQSSRFAAAAAADADYVNRDERERRSQDRDQERFDRYGGDERGPSRRPGGFRGGYDRTEQRNYVEPEPEKPSRVDELLKPKKNAAEENVLKPPTKEHEANFLKIPDKPLVREEDNFLAPPKREKAEAPAPAKKDETPAAAVDAVSAEAMAELLNEFASGNKQGDDLKVWVEQNRDRLPTVDRLIFHMLTTTQKLNPDPECGWAAPSTFGAALLALVEDDLLKQMQVLWGIQLYCDSIGFPKCNGEAVIQSMFRSMYKFDLAEADAFTEWKEDESDTYEKGKMNAIIQTVEWFNWLEEDEEEEEEEEEE